MCACTQYCNSRQEFCILFIPGNDYAYNFDHHPPPHPRAKKVGHMAGKTQRHDAGEPISAEALAVTCVPENIGQDRGGGGNNVMVVRGGN